MTKLAKEWNGKDLKGTWIVTYKIDGVRAISDGKNVWSRNGKPLYNLNHLATTFTDAEIFCGDFAKTISAVRTIGASPVPASCVYLLSGFSVYAFDNRLMAGAFGNPSAAAITTAMKTAVKLGYEGIVLRHETSGEWIKVKPVQTHDVPIIGFTEGKGKHAGRLGKLHTPMGDVGTGFTDLERTTLWELREGLTGLIIEVECGELTPSGKFRFPRFKHFRFDK